MPGENGDATFVRITNTMIWTKLGEIEAKLNDLSDYPETRKQVKALNFKFYGIVAGFVTVLALLATGLLGRIVG